ncbi:phage tail assembly chaperone [Aquamicrobium soli]|uniref:Uncharacterized protein n=1 Tax=Aquamicrobium soli TaxID=1811518 RepID=A0ABV7KAU0_9HYPH
MEEPPDEAEPAAWHDLYWRAWEALRNDRQYGAFGGASAVPYMAIRQYALDHGIVGAEFETFRLLFKAIDTEWLEIEARKAKQNSQPSVAR